jgi:hypothetical protein
MFKKLITGLALSTTLAGGALALCATAASADCDPHGRVAKKMEQTGNFNNEKDNERIKTGDFKNSGSICNNLSNQVTGGGNKKNIKQENIAVVGSGVVKKKDNQENENKNKKDDCCKDDCCKQRDCEPECE